MFLLVDFYNDATAPSSPLRPDTFAPGKEPYYPVNDARNSEIFKSYRELAVSRENVLFGGRLAQYTYADMDDTVAAALALAKQQFC